MSRERIGEDQRRAGFGIGMGHGDGHHAAQRQPADMRAINAKRLHRRQDGGGIIVAGRAFGRRLALAIAGIVERDRAPLVREMLELRMPDGAVRADAVEEDDRHALAVAGFVIADRQSEAGWNARHQFSRHAELDSAFIAEARAAFIKMDPETSCPAVISNSRVTVELVLASLLP